MAPETPHADPFAIVAPLPQAFGWLPFGQARPRGWVEAQLRSDLEHGFVGHLDALVPGLIRDDDLYGRDRLSLQVTRKDLGVVGADAAWQVQFLWWNSETQSNWRDGWVRTALLLDHEPTLGQVQAYVAAILASQDADGYLGIYGPDLRFRLRGENGELWAQASLFRVLLGYAEATGDSMVLAAVERAVQRTMTSYGPGLADPFAVEAPYAGVAHGLMLSDALERLTQLTGDEAYARFALWLYNAYSRTPGSEPDAAYNRLRDQATPFAGHGVHTYEHLRVLLAATYTSGNPLLQEALAAYLAKLERCLTPSGGPIGDEWIFGRDADAAATGYEYCSLHELLVSYTQLLQKTGVAAWGDRVEWLLFNAAQGARHPEHSAIAYLKTDTSTSMVGKQRPDDPDDPGHPQTRYKYSPAHQDVAVCCVPNAGRIYPYYVRAQWLRTADGLAAALYGPSELRTEVEGSEVRIVETTLYPLDLTIRLEVEVSAPASFSLRLRRPGWARGYRCAVNGQDTGEERAGWIVVTRTWTTGDHVTLAFEADPELAPFGADELTVRYGPLLFVRPIPASERPGRVYAPDFVDRYVEPDGDEAGLYQLDPEQVELQLLAATADPARPWGGGPQIAATLLHPLTAEPERVLLAPIGGTLLRQASFRRA